MGPRRSRPTFQRRHSETSVSASSRKPLHRLSCVQSHSSLPDWCELTTRQYKFRSREAATRSSKRRLSGDKPQHPSKKLRQVLDLQHNVCKDPRSTRVQRYVAVFLSWFYGKMVEAYSSMTDEGRTRSLFRWIVAVLLVAIMVILLLGFITVTAHFALNYLVLFLQAGLPFLFLVSSVCVMYLGAMAVLNFQC